MQEVNKGGIVTITRATKDCPTCETTKPIAEFGYHPHTKDKHKKECRECASKKVMVQWRKKRGEPEPEAAPIAASEPEPVVDTEPTLAFANPHMGMDPRLVALSIRVRELEAKVAEAERLMAGWKNTAEEWRRGCGVEEKRAKAAEADAIEWQGLAESLQRELDKLKADPVSTPAATPAPNRPHGEIKQITKTPADLAAKAPLPSGYPAWFNQIPGRFQEQAQRAYDEARDILQRQVQQLNDAQLRAIFEKAYFLATKNLPTGPDQGIVFRKLVKVLIDPLGQAEETFGVNHKANGTGQTYYKARTGYYRMVYHIENGQPKFLKIGHRRDFYGDELFQGAGK